MSGLNTHARREYLSQGAELSPDGLYRYRLWRVMSAGPRALFVMLNPSIADGTIDDPTITRCVGFAEREKCGALEVVNLFAWIQTDAKKLPGVAEPVGPRNDDTIRAAAMRANLVVCAWGAGIPRGADRRVDAALGLLPFGRLPRCFGTTAGGHPRHPLYLPKDEPLVPFAKAIAAA